MNNNEHMEAKLRCVSVAGWCVASLAVVVRLWRHLVAADRYLCGCRPDGQTSPRFWRARALLHELSLFYMNIIHWWVGPLPRVPLQKKNITRW
jgi:hypothetical protein